LAAHRPPRAPGTVERELSGLRLGGPSGQGPLFRLRALHLDRRAFDRAFAEQAVPAGVAVLSGTCLTGPFPSGGIMTETGPMRAWVTMFADGVNSAVREVMLAQTLPLWRPLLEAEDRSPEVPARQVQELFQAKSTFSGRCP